MADRVVIGAALAQRPFHGGHAWAIMQWALGFRALGWDVLLLDRLDASMFCDASGQPAAEADAVNAHYFLELMREFGFDGNAALLLEEGRTVGLSRREVLERTRTSAFLFNVMGFIDDEDVLAAAPLRVFFDIDPGFPQMWKELGLHDAFAGHDRFVTVGLNIGKPECTIPTCGLDWITTLPPVSLDHWPVVETHSRPFTSVAMWRGPYGPVEYRGRDATAFASTSSASSHRSRSRRASTSSSRSTSTRPRPRPRAPRPEPLEARRPASAAGTPQRYRRFVQESFAEISIAKEMYVKTRSGWFSDRSACYLASGKPVIAQSTGFEDVLPVGGGLLSFRPSTRGPQRSARGAATARAVPDARNLSSRVLRARQSPTPAALSLGKDHCHNPLELRRSRHHGCVLSIAAIKR